MSRSGTIAVLLALLVAGVCVRLGVWQLDRLEQRRERNARQEAALRLPPLDLVDDTLRAVLADPARFVYRRARLRGAFDPSGEVVLRGRARDGRPGVHLLTPLHLEGADAAVLVNRGWAPSADAATLDPRPLAERGTREIEAIVQPVPRIEGEVRMVVSEVGGERVLSVQRLDLERVRAHLAAPLLSLYLQQLPGPSDPALPARLPLPDLTDDGPHLGYAVQWFSFAAIALGGLVVVHLRGRRR